MKILIIRHAEPDYSIDSLTEKGWKEAEYLSERLCKMNIKDIYVSPLGRAKDTASFTLKKLGKTATECDWLREFPAKVEKPNRDNSVAWDWLPGDWTNLDEFYDLSKWMNHECFVNSTVKTEFEKVSKGIDEILAAHGYVRNGRIYNAENANNDTIALFCHFGVECVILSHLLNISPMPLWHGFCALPSSVTTLVTEERRKSVACFRTCGFGDLSHLYAKNEEPSFAARFCECYENEDERHD
jgi:probable phosphoglycerate mutase